jgi:hypothetical protein
VSRRYVPIVGRPGELAFVNRPGAWEGWHSVMPPGYRFDNRVPAGAGLAMLFYDAASMARRVRCPLLVCVSDKEDLMDPAIAVKVAADARRGPALSGRPFRGLPPAAGRTHRGRSNRVSARASEAGHAYVVTACPTMSSRPA